VAVAFLAQRLHAPHVYIQAISTARLIHGAPTSRQTLLSYFTAKRSATIIHCADEDLWVAIKTNDIITVYVETLLLGTAWEIHDIS